MYVSSRYMMSHISCLGKVVVKFNEILVKAKGDTDSLWDKTISTIRYAYIYYSYFIVATFCFGFRQEL